MTRLARNAVCLHADRAHEVAAAARSDVVGESVGFEVSEEFDHRLVAALEVATAERRVLRAVQEFVRLGLEVLDADPLVGRQDSGGQDLDVAVVARVVLCHQRTKPAVVTLMRCLPRLPIAQLRFCFGHLEEPAKDEVQLDRHRLLTPQGSVVVEHRDALLGRHGIRSVAARSAYEVVDRLLRSTVAPARQRASRRRTSDFSLGNHRHRR